MVNDEPQGRPARSLYEYCLCLAVLKGRSNEVDHETARATIHATPADARSAFAREIARSNRDRACPPACFDREPRNFSETGITTSGLVC